ncbi:hypothetical protein BH23ACT5_BH23ACT5_23420 [soil metagenome]
MTAPVTVQGLTYTYPGTARPALRDVSFTIASGEVFGFLGPSGAGKTTTQHVLTGLISGWTGSVLLGERTPLDWGRSLYDSIGVSFELPAGYTSLTAREDLAHFAALHRRPARPIDELLASLGLGAHVDQRLGSFPRA